MIKISICKGPVCQMYAEELSRAFEKAIEKAQIADQVELTSAFCMGECKNGPCVRINGVKFRHVDEDRAAQLVAQEVVPLLGK